MIDGMSEMFGILNMLNNPYREGVTMGESIKLADMFSPEHLKLRREIFLVPSPKKVNPKFEKLGWVDQWLCKRLTKHVCDEILTKGESVDVLDDIFLIHHMLLTFQKSGWFLVCYEHGTGEEIPYSVDYIQTNEILLMHKTVLADMKVDLEQKKIIVKLRGSIL